jgi:hypothetical protein
MKNTAKKQRIDQKDNNDLKDDNDISKWQRNLLYVSLLSLRSLMSFLAGIEDHVGWQGKAVVGTSDSAKLHWFS